MRQPCNAKLSRVSTLHRVSRTPPKAKTKAKQRSTSSLSYSISKVKRAKPYGGGKYRAGGKSSRGEWVTYVQ